MKNKLYFVLWVAYVLVIVLILQVNQVFSIGVERTSAEKLNLFLNLFFLLIIGILFAISTLSFIRLNLLTNSLSKVTAFIQKEDKDSYDTNSKAVWTTISTTKSLFGNAYLDRAMNEYRAQVRKNGNSFASTRFVSIDDFINESVIEKAGMNYFNSAMPGTLTGLGILGTFLGLSLGLASFSGEDIYTISDNVGPLLSGMKVAFHTSVYGIFFSLIFTFIYRSIISDAFEKLDRFLNTFKHFTNSAVREAESSSAMLVYQANTTALLKEILAYIRGTSNEQSDAMNAIVNRFCEQMSYNLDADFKALGDSLRDSANISAGSVDTMKNLSETTLQLVEISRQMVFTVDTIAKEQKEIEKRLLRQEEILDRTCDDLSARLLTMNMARDMDYMV